MAALTTWRQTTEDKQRVRLRVQVPASSACRPFVSARRNNVIRFSSALGLPVPGEGLSCLRTPRGDLTAVILKDFAGARQGERHLELGFCHFKEKLPK